jgi:hypothetical protein
MGGFALAGVRELVSLREANVNAPPGKWSLVTRFPVLGHMNHQRLPPKGCGVVSSSIQ